MKNNAWRVKIRDKRWTIMTKEKLKFHKSQVMNIYFEIWAHVLFSNPACISSLAQAATESTCQIFCEHVSFWILSWNVYTVSVWFAGFNMRYAENRVLLGITWISDENKQTPYKQ